MTSLPQELRSQYKARWDVLLDALFSDAPLQRASLLNPFIRHKKGGEILQFRSIVIRQLVDQIPDELFRHAESGLLSQYWCNPSSLLPILFANPKPNSKVLILGDSPATRILGLCYLLYPETNCMNNELPEHSSESNKGVVANEEPQAISRDETKQKPSQNSKFYQAALPWYVYGEGKPFETWNSDSGQDTSQEDLQKQVGPKQPPGTLQWILEGILFRSVRAGCCNVRTSSGDWAEYCDETTNNVPSESNTSQGVSHHTVLGSEVEQSKNLFIESETEESESQTKKLLENHIAPSVLSQIRLGTRSNDHAEVSQTSDNLDFVVFEAQCMVNSREASNACRDGRSSPWLSEEAEKNLSRQKDAIKSAFMRLREGGLMLFCSESLIRQETEDIVEFCLSSFKHSAKLIHQEDLLRDLDNMDLLVSAKKLGLEQTRFGWRMLPDLSFQKPQYFSLLKRECKM